MGDMNIHHRRWLRHSNDNTSLGAQLKEVCDDHALRQLIREPTRGQYLLDLVLTDIETCKAELTPSIADHRGLLVHLNVAMPQQRLIEREVWHFKGAAWSDLRSELKKCSSIRVGPSSPITPPHRTVRK